MSEEEKRKLPIDWSELLLAWETASPEINYYLDLETGEVVMVTGEAEHYLDEVLDEPLEDWMEEMLQQARQVEEGYGTRYVSVPKADSREGYRDMEDFIATVRDQRLQERLERAIAGRGAFRRFKDVLAEYPDERARWFAFKERRNQERALEWLESIGVEPLNPPELPPEPEPEEETQPQTELDLEQKLTLLLLYLSSWEEKATSDLSVRRAWKGYTFEVLDALEEMGLLSQSRRAKSVILTEQGVRLARELYERLKEVWE